MDVIKLKSMIKDLAFLDYHRMYADDFLLTWEKSDDEIQATFLVADILRGLRQQNISCRLFDSGLGISLFRDQSTRTRFSFASACNLLGLTVQDFDEGKSQVAHGETVRETANMISFMADVIGIRDDMYIGKGNTYMREVSQAVEQGHREGVVRAEPSRCVQVSDAGAVVDRGRPGETAKAGPADNDRDVNADASQTVDQEHAVGQLVRVAEGYRNNIRRHGLEGGDEFVPAVAQVGIVLGPVPRRHFGGQAPYGEGVGEHAKGGQDEGIIHDG